MNQRDARRLAAAELSAVAEAEANRAAQRGFDRRDADRMRDAYERLAEELARRAAIPPDGRADDPDQLSLIPEVP